MKASEINESVVDRLEGDYELSHVREEDGGQIYDVEGLAGVLVWISDTQTGILVSDNGGETWR